MLKRLHPNVHVQRLIGMALASAAISLCAWWMFNLLAPAQDNPFRPLTPATQPGLATGLKLDRLAHTPAACFALLVLARVKFTRLQPPRHAPPVAPPTPPPIVQSPQAAPAEPEPEAEAPAEPEPELAAPAEDGQAPQTNGDTAEAPAEEPTSSS